MCGDGPPGSWRLRWTSERSAIVTVILIARAACFRARRRSPSSTTSESSAARAASGASVAGESPDTVRKLRRHHRPAVDAAGHLAQPAALPSTEEALHGRLRQLRQQARPEKVISCRGLRQLSAACIAMPAATA